MVEQSLLERFAWPMPAIQDFFRGDMRASAVRTTSSITFDYRPATQPINPRLLAEEDRQEIAREEAESRVAVGDYMNLVTRNGGNPSDAATLTLAPPSSSGYGARMARSTQPMGRAYNPRVMVQEEDQETLGVDVPDGITHGSGERSRDLQRASERVMLGVGVNSEAGLVGDVTLNELPFSFQGRTTTGTDNGRPFFGPRDDKSRPNFTICKPVFAKAVTASDIGNLAAQQQNLVMATDRSGTLAIVNLEYADARDPQKAAALAAQLNKAGVTLLAGLGAQETGYWNPAIVTGADGKATVTVTVPDRSTAWKFSAKGITTETLAGETTSDLTVKKDLFGELKLPLAFTDGDEARVLASIHNDVWRRARSR